jgi:dolichol-phosphate mannosyltransferase
MKTTIVLPTYNEKENIEDFLKTLLEEINLTNDFNINILVVDDYSPDGTADIVKKVMGNNPKVNLLLNNTRGLGKAYIAGFRYAIENFSPDILIEMDSDFSHDVKKVKELLNAISKGADFAIGSRYIKGGSIPSDWALIRKLNSKYGNIFARIIAGLYSIKDCTSGFRAIKTDILKQIDLDKLNANGYSFQMNILFECTQKGAKVAEIPIDFIDRTKGKSKLGLYDILEFMVNSFILRLRLIKNVFVK